MLKNKILDVLCYRDGILDIIKEKLDYSGNENIEIVDETKSFWALNDGILILSDKAEAIENATEEYYQLEVSSYGNRGEKEYVYVDENLVLVMAYYDESGWDSAVIYVLEPQNKRYEKN